MKNKIIKKSLIIAGMVFALLSVINLINYFRYDYEKYVNIVAVNEIDDGWKKTIEYEVTFKGYEELYVTKREPKYNKISTYSVNELDSFKARHISLFTLFANIANKVERKLIFSIEFHTLGSENRGFWYVYDINHNHKRNLLAGGDYYVSENGDKTIHELVFEKPSESNSLWKIYDGDQCYEFAYYFQ